MPNLFVTATHTLNDDSTAAGLKIAAAEALQAALREGLEVPRDAVRALWRWAASHSGSRPWHAGYELGRVVDPEITREASVLLKNPAANVDEFDLAVQVLAGPGHARLVPADLLLELAERVHDEDRAHCVARLVEGVHHAPGVDPDVLRQIRDVLARSPVPGVRQAAVLISEQMVERDIPWITRMLEDPDADVRADMARSVCRDSDLAREVEHLVQEALRVEQVPHVRGVLLRALAAAEEDDESPRRPRRM